MPKLRFSFLLHFAYLILIALSLGGCASNSEAISQTVKMLLSRGDETSALKLSPEMHYLRVTTEGRVVILVLGYVNVHSDESTEVWYSATGEVLHIRNGRIIHTSGLATDWREVRYDKIPAWKSVGNMPIEIRRKRDEMPGYRMNIEDSLLLRAIAPPIDSRLSGVDAASFSWFEERSRQGDVWSLPHTRYAVSTIGDASRVMYAEQCLSLKLCLTWQRWPAAAMARAAGVATN